LYKSYTSNPLRSESTDYIGESTEDK